MSSNPIVETAIRLLSVYPTAPALEILDHAMEGRYGTSPDFEAHPKITCRLPYAYDDDTDPASPFGELLRQAFAPELGMRDLLAINLADMPSASSEEISSAATLAEEWQRVIDLFAERYNLWAN